MRFAAWLLRAIAFHSRIEALYRVEINILDLDAPHEGQGLNPEAGAGDYLIEGLPLQIDHAVDLFGLARQLLFGDGKVVNSVCIAIHPTATGVTDIQLSNTELDVGPGGRQNNARQLIGPGVHSLAKLPIAIGCRIWKCLRGWWVILFWCGVRGRRRSGQIIKAFQARLWILNRPTILLRGSNGWNCSREQQHRTYPTKQ